MTQFFWPERGAIGTPVTRDMLRALLSAYKTVELISANGGDFYHHQTRVCTASSIRGLVRRGLMEQTPSNVRAYRLTTAGISWTAAYMARKQ